MSLDFLILDGYGQYVWSAFIFTFICCFALYRKTRRELVREEKKFLSEFEPLPLTKSKVAKHRVTTREALSGYPSL